MNSAASKDLFQLIIELQSFELLTSFTLAGGTSLALYYNHRVSVDIDLFTANVTGIAGFEVIKNNLEAF